MPDILQSLILIAVLVVLAIALGLAISDERHGADSKTALRLASKISCDTERVLSRLRELSDQVNGVRMVQTAANAQHDGRRAEKAPRERQPAGEQRQRRKAK